MGRRKHRLPIEKVRRYLCLADGLDLLLRCPKRETRLRPRLPQPRKTHDRNRSRLRSRRRPPDMPCIHIMALDQRSALRVLAPRSVVVLLVRRQP